MAYFKKLFEPIAVGRLQLENRLVMLSMELGLSEQGRATPRLIDFIERRARGGAGLIITPFLPVYGGGKIMPGLYEDSFIPSLKELTGKVHHYGVPIAAQLAVMHEWAKDVNSKPEHISPSGVSLAAGITPKALTVEEIKHVIVLFGDAAGRARQAGFDAVEIHAGIGFLINQFISTATNKRTDEYGGNLENRMRFLLEILDSVQKKTGKDFTLICRIAAEDLMDGGHTMEETGKVVSILNRTGIHAYNVQVGWHESRVPLVQMSVKRGAFVYAAEAVKKMTGLPVIAAYRINDPVLAEQVLAEGKADLAGMARAFLADPDFAVKAKEGRIDDIRTCIACCRCLDLVFSDKTVGCTVNAAACREAEFELKPVVKTKKVLVVGGGPAGMEAAIVAASRGHNVTLWDQKAKLGGQLQLASIPPHKEEIAGFNRYLANQVEKNHIRIRLNRAAGAEEVKALNPDAVIIATGASQIIPELPGVKGNNVITATDVLLGRKETGKEVIIVGGGMIGCETAEFLSLKGKKVTVLEMLPRLAGDIGAVTRWTVLQRMRNAGIKSETKAKVVEINEKGVKFERDGKLDFLAGDSIILAVGMRPNKELFQELKEQISEIYSVGDCAEPQKIAQAIEAGYKVGMSI